jgi:hypothetical protein
MKDRLKRPIAHGEHAAREKGCCECNKWTPEYQHHEDVVQDTTKYEDKYRSDQPSAISTQEEIQPVEKMADTGIPDPPEPMEAWLAPAIEESAFQN